MQRLWGLIFCIIAVCLTASGRAQVISEEPVAEFPPAVAAPQTRQAPVIPSIGGQPPAARTQPSPQTSSASPVAIQPQQPPTTLPPANQDFVSSIQPSVEDLNRQARGTAFDAAVSGILPLSPEQIRELMRRVEDSQMAASLPLAPPRPETKVATISLDPGVEPPEIHVAAGMVTTLTLLDATGQPWPIHTVAYGGNFDVPQPEDGAHILRITPLTKFGQGNLSITLVNLATPITFKLVSGGDVVHYRFDARVPEYGPNAQIPIISRAAQVSAGDNVVMAVLDGLPPSGSRKLNVGGVDTRTSAWRIGDRIYLRTPLKLLSPAWTASVSSADGMTVYEVNDAPVFLLSDNGVLVRARITLREKVNEY